MSASLFLLVGASIALLAIALVWSFSGRKGKVVKRLRQIEQGLDSEQSAEDRQGLIEEMRSIVVGSLRSMGEGVAKKRAGGGMQIALIQAGYRSPHAMPVFYAIQLISMAALGVLALAATPLFTKNAGLVLGAAFYSAGIGWFIPRFLLKRKVSARQRLLRKALPDTLDLLVVCVEAGLGLNQAIVRVAEEIGKVCPPMGLDLRTVNFEIQAGTPREEAFRNFASRTGADEIQALVAMLIQADRFGTSVATALRVQSESMRTKRRQLAEEAAAKTTIKMIFPLIFFIFPSLFVVILGPAAIQIIDLMAGK